MITCIHNLTNEATRSQKSLFWSPVSTPCFGNGLRHEQEFMLSLPQAVLAGKGFEDFSIASDKTSEYSAPPIAPASLSRKVTS